MSILTGSALGGFPGKNCGFLSLFFSSYRVVVKEFMEQRVVAVTKSDGFEEVLAALNATTNKEYPVVESKGRVVGVQGPGGHGTSQLVALWSPHLSPVPSGSPTLVGTISRAKLVAFLQSHEHPQAPPGPLQEKVSLGHPKKTFFPPKHTAHRLLYPTAASLHWDAWGGLCH